MKRRKPEPMIQLIDLISCLSDAMDYIDPAVVSHHKQVAYISLCLAEALGMSEQEQKDLILAGALHDIGAFSLKERKKTLSFEISKPMEHSERGFALLRLFDPLADVAPIVRYHHLRWEKGRGQEYRGSEVPLASHIIHLADRIAVLIKRKQEVLGQVDGICKRIRSHRGTMFNPEIADAFFQIASKEYFWLDLISPSLQAVLSGRLQSAAIRLNSEDMIGFSRLFSRIIDFKSPFTATHSRGVSTTASRLAGLAGFPQEDTVTMEIAGYLHDLGKLAVPVEILDKPARLNENEFNVVRHHTFYTYRILETIPALKTINEWASYHHERLDGSGYPFHLGHQELTAGSQIMAVADVFTAITEDRPYRAGMSMSKARRVLSDMVRDSALNGEIVSLLIDNYDELNSLRAEAQREAVREYMMIH